MQIFLDKLHQKFNQHQKTIQSKSMALTYKSSHNRIIYSKEKEGAVATSNNENKSKFMLSKRQKYKVSVIPFKVQKQNYKN